MHLSFKNFLSMFCEQRKCHLLKPNIATEILKTLPLRIIKKVCLAQNQFHIVMTYHIGYPMRCFDILLGYTINQYCSNYPVDLLLHCIEPE